MERHRRRRPRASTGNKLLVFIIIGVVVVGFLGLVALGLWGLGLVSDQVAADLRENPVVLEHLGAIEEIQLNYTATAEEPDEDTFVFDVVGSKGSGRLTVMVITVDADTEEVVAGTLRAASGETYDLFPE